MSDTARRFIIIMVAILVAYFFLHVMRSFNVAAEARGLCAGIAGYMAGAIVASVPSEEAPSSRRRRRRKR